MAALSKARSAGCLNIPDDREQGPSHPLKRPWRVRSKATTQPTLIRKQRHELGLRKPSEV